MITLVYLADGSLLDLTSAKVVPLDVVRELRKPTNVRSITNYRYAIVRCGWQHAANKPNARNLKVRIHVQSKVRRLVCPICKRLTAYASQMSITPLDDDGAVASIP